MGLIARCGGGGQRSAFGVRRSAHSRDLIYGVYGVKFKE
ncbi:hypothetical protein D1AOALGA4SA_11124 [Olavius algarvensis Delta 1 endosymbiont]|nr:hypothetical protein D1AOALGA4SA_11124 [Olavius algarvensis Delta 1 endosymbiont]